MAIGGFVPSKSQLQSFEMAESWRSRDAGPPQPRAFTLHREMGTSCVTYDFIVRR